MPNQKVTINPTAVLRNAGWTNVGGADVIASLTDSLDSSYVEQAPTTAFAESTLDLTMADPAIPAGAKIVAVHSYMRVADINGIAPNSGPTHWLGIGQRVDKNGRIYVRWHYYTIAGTSPTTYSWPVTIRPYDGGEYSPTDLNNLILVLQVFQQTPNRKFRVYLTYFEVEYNERPTVTVTAPVGTLTGEVRPTVTYTWADTENDPELWHEVKVFSAAQYGAAGFDPSTSTATWYPGREFSGFLARNVEEDLVNGTTYRAYARAGQAYPRGDHASAWAYSEFTISLTPLTTPTLAVTPQPSSSQGPRVELAVSGVTAANTTIIEYSDDAGVTWTPHPRHKALTGATSYTVYDYELAAGTSRRYRARQVSSINTSAYTAASADQTLTFDAWWLKDIKDATKNVEVGVQPPFDLSRREDQGVFWPLGRATPVVVAGDLRSRVGALDLVFTSDSEWTKFEAIRATQRTLLLQFEHGGQMWLRLGEEVGESTLHRASGQVVRRASVNFVETDPVV